MLCVEATTSGHKHIPFSIRWADADRVSPEAKTHHAGRVRDVAACELTLSGYQLAVG
jgi:hypothetical protein